jgi:polysaccharide biosynthesis protein PslH
MRILLLTQIVPYPPDSGPRVKTWNVLRYLSERGHHITLVSFVRPEEESYIPGLREICEAVYAVPIHRSRAADARYMLRSYITGRPFLVERDNLRPMQELVNKLISSADFDFIHADQLTMVQFALRGAAVAQAGKPKVIFDAHNAVWTIVERMRANANPFLKPVLGAEVRRVKRYEGELLTRVDQVLAVTEVDNRGFQAAFTSLDVPARKQVAPISVIPIAVDTRELQPVRRKPGSDNIVTLGTLHYPPNADGIRWFLNEVFPLVRQHVPNVKVTIIGKNPPADFLELAARNPDAVRVTGYVRDLVPCFEESSLMVVPVRAGGGMRVRILEAFAYAMPVVTTTVGLEGIQAEPGKDVLIADSPVDFANSVVRLLGDDALQARLSTNGRRLAESQYDWRVTLKDLDRVYQRPEGTRA